MDLLGLTQSNNVLLHIVHTNKNTLPALLLLLPLRVARTKFWFANTVSNLPLVVFPVLNVVRLWPFLRRVNPVAIWPHALLALNGLASAYYHATLSLFGQLVDELLILHILNTCLVAYTPVLLSNRTKLLKEHLLHIRLAIVLLSVSVSALCFIKPAVNAFALMSFSLPGAILVYQEGTRNGAISEAPQLTKRILLAWTLALCCWLADRMICELWLKLGTPYLHAFWHLFAAYAAYNVLLMFSLLDIKRSRESKQHNFGASIRYFPLRRALPKGGAPFLAIPFLRLENYDEANAKYLE